MPDVSLVLAAHREGDYLTRALRSLAEAARYAGSFGIGTELIAVLDRADAPTEAAVAGFDFSDFVRHHVMRVDHGSLGPTRNAGCAVAAGTYIATADADDLVSFNYVERMFAAARQAGPKAILIPEFLIAFDASEHIAEYFGLDAVTPLGLFADHPFVSRIFLHRSVFDTLRYADIALTQGYAYEDWHFNCNAVAQGCTFQVAANTVLFYRQRGDSLLNRGKRLSVRQIPPSPMFQPERYRALCAPALARLRAEGDFRAAIPRKGRQILSDPRYRGLLNAAQAIDPAIAPDRLQAADCFNYLDGDLTAAMAYDRACAAVLGRRFGAVVLGGPKALAGLPLAFGGSGNGRGTLFLCDGPVGRRFGLEHLPGGSVGIDLRALAPPLPPEHREVLCLKLLQHCAEGARLHLIPAAFPQRFLARFAPVLAPHRPVIHRIGLLGALQQRLRGTVERVGVE